eukprot:6821963-Prymnesium_polylepis.1
MSAFTLAAVAASLRPTNVRINRAPATDVVAAVDSRSLSLTVRPCGSSHTCARARADSHRERRGAYRISMRDTDDRVVFDSGRRADDTPRVSGLVVTVVEPPTVDR